AATNTIEVSNNIENVSSESKQTGELSLQVERLSQKIADEMAALKENLATILRSSEAGNRRQHTRRPIHHNSTLHYPGGSLSCTIIDISEGGVKAKCASIPQDITRGVDINFSIKGKKYNG